MIKITMQTFPRQFLDDGKQVYFGQGLQEIEKMFAVSAIDNTSPVARKGKDKIIKTHGVTFDFDTDLLSGITFSKDHQFKNSLSPYIQIWKNFESIGDKKIKSNMTHDDFVDYIEAWNKRAKELSSKEVESPDLKENEYRISFEEDGFSNAVHIAMGKSRRAGGGGIWADGWTIFFATEREAELYKVPVGQLRSVSAFCDVFNTVARR
jgi:hypothetical protein